MAIDPSKVASTVSGFFGGNKGKAPAGVSQLFWDTTNNSPEAEAIRRSKQDMNSPNWGKSDAEIRAQIDKLIANKWAQTPPERKTQWTTQDASGSKHTPGSVGWQEEQNLAEAGKTGDTNLAAIDAWEKKYGGFDQVAKDAAQGNQDAINRLQELLGTIKDPAIQDYVGDVVSQGASAHVDPETIAAQKRALSKYESLYDPSITAEERLMQETSRLKQEQDLKSQRGAFANDLQARGVYGGGAELTMNLAASQQAAQQRAMDEMTALANAQKRSMDALSGGSELSTAIRTGEAQETQYRASAADVAAQANRQFRDSYDKWRTEQEGRNNAAKVLNQTTVTNAITGANRDKVSGAISGAATGLQGAQTGIDVRNNILESKNAPRTRLGNIDVFDETKGAFL